MRMNQANNSLNVVQAGGDIKDNYIVNLINDLPEVTDFSKAITSIQSEVTNAKQQQDTFVLKATLAEMGFYGCIAGFGVSLLICFFSKPL